MEERGRRKVRVGTVVSARMRKTCVVEIERLVNHPMYKKVLRRRKRVMVHDEDSKCQVGDLVRIVETRPLSRRKRWRYVETVREAPSAMRGKAK
jgi:small subunit ribosomal protein S17